MKRIIHALAALWPLGKKSPRTGPIVCKSADLPIRKIASESAHPQISESILNNKTIFHLDRRYCNVLAYMTLFMCLIARGQDAPRVLPSTGTANMDNGREHWVKYLLVLFLAVVFTTIVNVSHAQFHRPSEITVRMGETLPKSFYHTVHQAVNMQTGEKVTISLADYSDKLIILDFWASWCGPCIYSLNKLDSLKRNFKEDGYIVIPVTYQPIAEAARAFSRYKWDFISIVADTVLGKIFPHGGLPHMVWLQDSKVVAMPKWDYATAGNITAMINNSRPRIYHNINDRMVDPYIPLFKNGNGDAQTIYESESGKLVGYIPGYRRERINLVDTGDGKILYGVNQRIEQLFYNAFKADIFPHLSRHEGSGIIWEVGEDFRNRFLDNTPEQSFSGNFQQDSLYHVWLTHNTFSYVGHFSDLESSKGIYGLFQRDLNAFFGEHFQIEARIEHRKIQKYAVLRLFSSEERARYMLSQPKNGSFDKEKIITHEGVPFGQHFIMRIAQSLKAMDNAGFSTWQIVVDSTGIDPSFPSNFEFPKSMWGNLDLIQEQLGRYGMYLTIEEKAVPVLVVRQRVFATDTPDSMDN